MPSGDWLRVMWARARDGVSAWLSPWPVGLAHVLIVIALAAVAWVAVIEGVALRRGMWDATESIRFCGDIDRGYRYGRRAMEEGFVDLYSRVYAETTARGRANELNYAPMRLAVMTCYARQVRAAFPEATQWQRYPYEFTRPVLRVNMAMELASAAGVFVLVVIWMRRAARGGMSGAGGTRWTWVRDLSPFAGWFTATVAAGLVWFNPASWINAHGWPLWDIWVVPFFLWALVAASLNGWLLSGVILGVGAMFKGQQMLVAPLFLMLPLFMGRPGAAGRWIGGYVLGLALVVWPWMLTVRFEPVVAEGAERATVRDAAGPFWNWRAIAWVAGVAMVSGVAVATSWALGWRVRRAMPGLAAAATGAAVFACVPLFDADLGWLRVGLLRGTETFSTMYVANAYNVPALLDHMFGFHPRRDLDRELFPVVGHMVTLKQLMAAIYFVLLVLCAAAGARHWRRGDPRVLVALTAPWLLMFTVMTQMHERYLLFFAAMSAVLIAVRWPYVLMTALLSLLSLCMTADTMLGASRNHLRRWPMDASLLDGRWIHEMSEAVRSIFPGAAWAVVACCLVVLVDALGVGRLRKAGPAPPPPVPPAKARDAW